MENSTICIASFGKFYHLFVDACYIGNQRISSANICFIMFFSFLGEVAKTPFLTFWNAEGGSCKGLVLDSHRLFLLLQVLSFVVV